MRAFLIALFFTGVVLVVVNALFKTQNQPPRVQYTYLPRDLDTYLREQPHATVEFQSMFSDADLQLART